MAFTFLRHRWQKILAYSLLIIISLVLILSVFVNRYWSPILAKKVKSVVLTSSDSLYTVDFTSAELHILSGEIIIYNINFRPDTTVYNRRKKQHLAPNNLVELHVKRLILSHIHPFRLYFKHQLDIGEIILTQPELNLSYQLNHTRDTVIKDKRTPWQKISRTLHSIHIGDIFLNDVKLRYSDHSGSKVAVSELKEMNLSATDLLIDSATQTDRSRVLYCRDIVTELNNYTGKAPNGLYTYKINHLKLSTFTSQLNMEGLVLEPVKTAAFFSKSKQDKYTLRLDSLQLNNFDYLSYHKYRTVSAKVLLVKNGTLALYSNPHYIPTSKASKLASFPAVALSNFTTNLTIDTLLVRHIDVVYSEYNKKSNKTGSIRFDHITGRITNISNNKAALQKNNMCTAELTTDFMGKGKLKVSFTFNLTDKNNAFSYKGSLGYMNLEAINPATMPLAMVKITSGTVKLLNFDIHADRNRSKGKLTLLYNNLKIKLLKADSTLGLKQKLIPSLYANLFIIKHNNPDKEGEPARTFDINYTRPDMATFFSSVWQTLLSGIKPSAGVDKKTEAASAVQMTQHDLKKQQRLQKREMRRQRRQERRMKRELKRNKRNNYCNISFKLMPKLVKEVLKLCEV